jgi:hypothetical protein
MADDTPPLDKQLDSIERRFGSWQNYKTAFARLSEHQRQQELFIFDQALDGQRPTPTKTFASHLQKRRELTGLDHLLRSVRR